MRAIYIAVLFCLGARPGTAWAYEHFVSGNHRFEAYTTANNADGIGMKLFVRRHGSNETGVLLATNDRWLDAKWSPDSRFLAVGNHSDGHITDVYVFGVVGSAGSPPLDVALYAHSPDLVTYDVQWKVVGWRLHRREVLLKKSVKFRAFTGRECLPLDGPPLPPSTWPR